MCPDQKRDATEGAGSFAVGVVVFRPKDEGNFGFSNNLPVG